MFSTAQPVAASAAAVAALQIVASEPERRGNLLCRAARLRQQLQDQGWDTGQSASQIIPLCVGSAGQTMRLAEQLRGLAAGYPASARHRCRRAGCCCGCASRQPMTRKCCPGWFARWGK